MNVCCIGPTERRRDTTSVTPVCAVDLGSTAVTRPSGSAPGDRLAAAITATPEPRPRIRPGGDRNA